MLKLLSKFFRSRRALWTKIFYGMARVSPPRKNSACARRVPSRVGPAPAPPENSWGDAILIKTDFCIRRIVRGKFDRCDFTKIGLHFESQLRI